MAKRFHIFKFGGDNTKEVAEIISNKTSRRILDHLREKESSETEISKELNIPISTVHYHLQKLNKSKLIDIKDFYWSPKGNKVNTYRASDKPLIFTQEKSTKILESKLGMILTIAFIVSLLAVVNILHFYSPDSKLPYLDKVYKETSIDNLNLFDSCSALTDVFNKAITERVHASGGTTITSSGDFFSGIAESTAPSGGTTVTIRDYSPTNIQVEGVDEADIVKTDGEYIYLIAKNKLVIARAYPENKAEIVSETNLEELNPNEIFIDKDRLLIFGVTSSDGILHGNNGEIYPKTISLTTVQLFDIKDKDNPELIKSLDIEGNYLTSRKIDSQVYFVVNSSPQFKENGPVEDIIPFYRETSRVGGQEVFTSIAGCSEIGYFEPVNTENIINVISLSMENPDEINKKVIAGNGDNIYMSLDNLYIAETNKGNTNVHKFSLEDGEISYLGDMKVPGTVLNQFSMDEHNTYFRIATTIGDFESNNVYVYDKELNQVGKLENLAKGERIYSARFMGNRAYLITFRRIDPLFVIDLSSPKYPKVLGELKIPGYSDYLHPYDENHLIGIGKDTIETSFGGISIEGVKLALFDVSDVNNPRQLYKEIIGGRGTHSEVLEDHKAFLFDKNRNLLVIPVYFPGADYYEEGVFEGAYVYELTLYGGFDLMGKIEHKKIRRNLYIEDILYTISEGKIQLNSFRGLEKIKELIFQ